MYGAWLRTGKRSSGDGARGRARWSCRLFQCRVAQKSRTSRGALPSACTVCSSAGDPVPGTCRTRTFHIVYAGHFVHPDRILAQCEHLLMPALFKLFAAVSEQWLANLSSSPYTLLGALLADLNVDFEPEELAEFSRS